MMTERDFAVLDDEIFRWELEASKATSDSMRFYYKTMAAGVGIAKQRLENFQLYEVCKMVASINQQMKERASEPLEL